MNEIEEISETESDLMYGFDNLEDNENKEKKLSPRSLSLDSENDKPILNKNPIELNENLETPCPSLRIPK